MSEFIDKAKVVAGQHADSPGMIIKGAKQQAKGQAQKVAGAIKGLLGDRI